MAIYLNNGDLFANEHIRVVYGKRGAYVEFDKDQIIPPLVNKQFSYARDDVYYIWKHPQNNPSLKVYLQLKTVAYADYKIGKYYVALSEFRDFKQHGALF